MVILAFPSATTTAPPDAPNDDDYRGYLATKGWTVVDVPVASGSISAEGLFTNDGSNGLLIQRGETLALVFRGTDAIGPAVLGRILDGTGAGKSLRGFSAID